MRHRLLRLRFWLLWPGLYLYFHGSHRSRVLIMDGDSVLLVQDRFTLWFDDGTWTVPGGGIHRDEPPATAAARELNEELGISIDPATLVKLGSGPVASHGLSYRASYFLLHLSQTTPLRLQRRELQQAAWFSRSTLPATMKRDAVAALELLADRS